MRHVRWYITASQGYCDTLMAPTLLLSTSVIINLPPQNTVERMSRFAFRYSLSSSKQTDKQKAQARKQLQSIRYRKVKSKVGC